jgi:hypothetical protein
VKPNSVRTEAVPPTVMLAPVTPVRVRTPAASEAVMPPSPPVAASSAALMAATTAAGVSSLAIVTLTALPPLRPAAWMVKLPPV